MLVVKQKFIGDLYGVEVHSEQVANIVDWMIDTVIDNLYVFNIDIRDKELNTLTKILYPSCLNVYERGDITENDLAECFNSDFDNILECNNNLYEIDYELKDFEKAYEYIIDLKNKY